MKPMKIKSFHTYQAIRFRGRSVDYFDVSVKGMHNISAVLNEGFIFLRNHELNSKGDEELILISVSNVACMIPLTKSDIDKNEKLSADYQREIQAIQDAKDEQQRIYEERLAELEAKQVETEEETLEDLFTDVDKSDDLFTDVDKSDDLTESPETNETQPQS